MPFPTITQITPLPPRGSDPEVFRDGYNTWFAEQPQFIDDVNAAGQYIEQRAVDIDDAANAALVEIGAEVGKAQAAASDAETFANDANDSAQIAQSIANFKGRWVDLSGALSIPATVLHDGNYWNLTQNVANVSAQEPSDTNAFWDKLELIQEVSRPTAISPISGATGVIPQPTLEASPYEVIYSADVRLTRRFQVDLASGDFSTPVYEATENADSHTVVDQLAFDTSHKWRCRDESIGGRLSQWMSVQSFSTGNVTIAQPTLTVEGSPDDVPEAPLLETSAFSVLGGSDTHLNTDWQVLDDQLNVVWESLAAAANKLSISVPMGVLETSTTYTFRARHRGEVYGVSPWRNVIATTRESFFLFGPGPQEMIAYDENTDTGYYGEVDVADLFTGDELASAIGLSAGTSQHSTTGWLKFYVGPAASCYRSEDAQVAGQGYVVFIAKRPYRNNVSWDQIYQAGAVYGVDNNGLYPTGTPQNQLTAVTKDSFNFKVQLMTGAENDPTSWTSENNDPAEGETSYWNELMYRVHVDVPARQNGDNWDSFTDSDIIVASGNGRASWMQETQASDTSRRVYRGLTSLTYFTTSASPTTAATLGWRPMLVVIA